MNTISDLVTWPWSVFSLFAASRLKVFSVVGDREMTAEEIARRCGAVPELLQALLNACVGMGLIRIEGGKYVNSDLSRAFLVEGEPSYVGDLVNLLHAEAGRWLGLSDIIRSGRQPDERRPRPAPEHRNFILAMDNLGMLGEAEALKRATDLSRCRRMVDAGGGSGLYSVVLCRKYPELRSTILDVREHLEVARELTKKHEERERIEFREANLTRDSFGENIDAVLLSDVLYDSSEAESILDNAWNCLRPGGLLIVRGYYADPEDASRTFGALFVLNMLVFDPTREVLTLSSLPRCVRERGFAGIEVSELTERSTVLTARKA